MSWSDQLVQAGAMPARAAERLFARDGFGLRRDRDGEWVVVAADGVTVLFRSRTAPEEGLVVPLDAVPATPELLERPYPRRLVRAILPLVASGGFGGPWRILDGDLVTVSNATATQPWDVGHGFGYRELADRSDSPARALHASGCSVDAALARSSPAATAFLEGSVTRDGVRVRFASGPAYDAVTDAEEAYVVVSPAETDRRTPPWRWLSNEPARRRLREDVVAALLSSPASRRPLTSPRVADEVAERAARAAFAGDVRVDTPDVARSDHVARVRVLRSATGEELGVVVLDRQTSAVLEIHRTPAP